MLENNYFVKKFRSLLSLSPRVRKLLMRIGLFIAVFELVKIVPPYIFKEVIDALVIYTPGQSVEVSFLLILLAGYLVSLLTMSLIEHVAFKRMHIGIHEAETDIARRTLRKLLNLDLAYHERNNTGQSMNRLLKGQTKMNELLFDMAHQFVPVMFQTFFTFLVLLWIGFEIGIAFLFFIPMFVIIIRRGVMETQEHRQQYYREHDRFASIATQSVVNIRTVKDFNNERGEQRKTNSALKSFLDALALRTVIGMKNFLTQEILTTIARVVTLALAVWLMVKGEISAGSLVLAMTLSEKAYINLSRLYRTYYRVQDAEPAIDQFREIQDHPVAVRDVRSKKKITKGMIEFRNATFSYPGTKENALSNVTFTVEPRTTLALVGKSGAGKSTVVKLLFRHMDVDSGDILVDGTSVKGYGFGNLRGSMAVVSQDVELFNESVMANIAYGTDKGMRAVKNAAKLANAHEFIMRLPGGYDTLVGERGVKLSGGQKQRIAIARAILMRPKILVFDEATSSLDAESEKLIHEAIFSLVGKLTLVVIAHRFSTVEHVDRIVLLDEGRVEEIGTHEQLVRKKGIFARLRKLQELGEVS